MEEARILMGPGPSTVPPRVLAALAKPTIGHLDPEFLALMDDVQESLRRLFHTNNKLTFPVSATGSAGMEACLANVLEPGDRVVIGVNGVFGGRMVDIAERLGCDVVRVEAPWGSALDPDQFTAAIAGKKTKLVACVHAETSTGVRTDISDVAAAAKRVDALVLADCVTSLGGIPVRVDEWGVDLAYSGTQKCLSCPPGLAPVTFSERAVHALKSRKSKVSSWYLDASMLLNYWGGERAYHHTAPINMIFALAEALRVVEEEGEAAVFARHDLHHRALVAGLEALGLELIVEPDIRLPQLNTVRVPVSMDEAALRKELLFRFGIEIGGGLGSFNGTVWRIGLMGHTARRRNVVTLLGALETILAERDAVPNPGAALAAATRVWSS